ncbi:MAG: hypothetical protein GF401_07555, partial [Chitinivibrionales bacterium]|nr:hypothetical protein [Chitinivibrionales bacterium]
MIKRISRITLFLYPAALLVLFGCAPVRQIRPLEKGESSVHVGLGGPITQVGDVYIPLPLLSVGYNRGMHINLDIEFGSHITQAMFGIMHLNGGVNWRPVFSKGLIPGIIISPSVHFMTDFEPQSVRIYPVLDLNGYWKFAQKHYVYAGIENWFELTRTRGDGLQQEHHWLIAPHIGASLGVKKWDILIEGVVYTPNLLNTGRGTKNIGLGDQGVLGVFLG